MRYLAVILLVTILNLGSKPAFADEGMWFHPLLSGLSSAELKKIGLSIDSATLSDLNCEGLLDVICIFGGSCTASLISGEGLLLTVHHCAMGTLAYHNTEDTDRLQEGYWAQTREQELHTPGESARFILSMKDVTEEVLCGLDEKPSEDERLEAIREKILLIESEAKLESYHDVEVKSFFNGNRYFLIVSVTYRDVRLVGAPPYSIGYFGGETDNFSWPRHTGDFALFRIYTAPDGTPADYSPDNIPLRSENFLKISRNGIQPEDPVTVAGFPGSTSRYQTPEELRNYRDVTLKSTIDLRDARLGYYREAMEENPDLMSKYESKYQGALSYLNFNRSQYEELQSTDLIEKKVRQKERLVDWIGRNEERKKMYADIFNDIGAGLEEQSRYTLAKIFLTEGFLSIEALYLASRFLKIESMLDDVSNGGDGLGDEIRQLRNRVDNFFGSYYVGLDIEYFNFFLEKYFENIRESLIPEGMSELLSDSAGNLVDAGNLLTESMFTDSSRVHRFLENPQKGILDKDPLFILARETRQQLPEIYRMLRQENLHLSRGRRLFMEALCRMEPTSVSYPDANRTFRFNPGKIYGSEERGQSGYMTYLDGMIAKEDTANREFKIDPRTREMFGNNSHVKYSINGRLPLCVLSDNDVTGGFSGSPMLNRQGHLVGLVFDGNQAAKAADLRFDSLNQRTISLHIDFILFMIDIYGDCGRLMDELEIIKN